MERERQNFYIMLELDYDPPVNDIGRIRSALRAKKQEWTRWQDNPGKRNLALTNLGLAAEIERVMLDPLLRDQEAKNAVAIRDEMLQQFEAELRILEGKGYILPRELSAIAAKYKLYGVDEELAAKAARRPVSETPVEPPLLEESGEILDRITAKNIHRNLELLGYGDLYEFLGEPQYSSVKKLCEAAEQKRRAAAASGSRSSEATITQELSGICLQLFTDFDSKQKYDRYLKVGRSPALCDMIDEEFARSKFLSPDSLIRLVNFGVERCDLRVLEAEDLIRRYCAAYGIPVGERVLQLACPSCAARVDREAQVCSVCAQPLRGNCPVCGAAFEHGPAACSSCGFPIGEMSKALRNISDAETALIENNWSTARRCLEYADKYWPGHPKTEPLKKRANLLEERYSHYMDNIADCVAHNQYYAALDLVREASSRRIPLPLTTVAHVERVVSDLEDKLAEYQQADPPPTYEDLLALMQTVEDSMELAHMMRRFPPEPPGKLIAAVGGKQVRLTWSVSESPGTKEYIVVRRQDAVPLTAYDGDVVYQGPANSYLDDTPLPLKHYHYAVYTRRGGTVSLTAAGAPPVLIIPDIQKLRLLPVDSGSLLDWEYDPDIKEVLIWRKLGGDRPAAPEDGIALENDRLDGFTDSRLKNGVEYWYYLVAVYHVNGKKVYSRGVSGNVIPRKMQAPIEDLVVARTDGDPDEYVASWQGSQYSDVLLFVSHRKPACRKGEMLALSDLNEQYRKLDLDAKQPESARFHYSWNGGIYIFPAALAGKFATVGEIKYLANVKDVQSPTYDIIDKDLFLNMKWQPGQPEIAVTYRFDRFAKTPTEPGSNLIRYTREQYDYDAGVRIPDVEPAVYYVTIFAVFVTPDGERVYSPGINLPVNNTAKVEVFYRFQKSRKLFSQTSVITVVIKADEPFILPTCTIAGKVGRLPLSKNDGIPLFAIDRETRVEGSVVYEYRTSSLPDDLYIRLFFQDESQYEHLRLLPTGSLKIT